MVMELHEQSSSAFLCRRTETRRCDSYWLSGGGADGTREPGQSGVCSPTRFVCTRFTVNERRGGGGGGKSLPTLDDDDEVIIEGEP